MKYIFLTLSFSMMMLNAHASIEASSTPSSQPSKDEISKNRACFEELSVQGCGDPGDDTEQFRSCMSNVHETLDPHCKQLMQSLYGTK